jgi:hypothetical protein
MDRVYTPDANDVLYHYCSASTLQAMLASRRIRFTDINMLNDSEEARWGYSVFEEASTRLLKRLSIPEKVPHIDLTFIESVDEYISPIQLIAHPFVACFSTEPDSLSQWRAYGDDGRGFAIGFRAAALAALPVTLLKVEYDREKQVTEMMQALVATYQRRQEDRAPESEFMEDCCLLATYMVAFKHPAFAYENEIRCVHVVNVNMTDERLRFVDLGGSAGGVDVGGETIGFQVRDNHLTAFLDVPLHEPHAQNFIGEVVLGPKNHSIWGNIQLFLGACGLPKAKLRQSDVPYR